MAAAHPCALSSVAHIILVVLLFAICIAVLRPMDSGLGRVRSLSWVQLARMQTQQLVMAQYGLP